MMLTLLLRTSTRIITSLVLTLGFMACGALAFAAPGTAPIGVVDQAQTDDDSVTLSGWTGVVGHDNAVQRIEFYLNDKLWFAKDISKMSQSKRQDVIDAIDQSFWTHPGWATEAKLPDDLVPGVYVLSAVAFSTSGAKNNLTLGPAAGNITYNPLSITARLSETLPKIAAAIILIFFVLLFFQADRLSVKLGLSFNRKVAPSTVFGTALLGLFLGLVALGITGSSFGLGVKQTPFLESDLYNLWGLEQPVRGDEWRVLTPNIIAQTNHTPPFPVTNKNLGDDGQNMLIVGMTGVPVHHISAIAKPATWGFFVFDLRRALSWDWLFPIFGSLFACWAVLGSLRPDNWRTNFILSLCLSASAYSVAWSNWPAYTLLFPCIIYLCTLKLLRPGSVKDHVTAALFLGLALAGFVLVLYPPWQISVGYAFLALTAGMMIRDKLYRNLWRARVMFCLLASLVIACGILFAWWQDAHLAIQKMTETIYPGQRSTITGGSITSSFLLRGFTNIYSIRQLDSPASNQSEIASFYFMLLPLMLLFTVRAFQKQITAVEICLASIVLFILIFMFVGIPGILADISLWGRVTPNRGDLALNFACTLLIALLAPTKNQNKKPSDFLNLAAIVCSVIWGAVIYISLSKLPESITAGFTPQLKLFTLGISLLLGYFLGKGMIRTYAVLLLALSTLTTYDFNPVSIAPSEVAAKLPETNGRVDNRSRILTLESAVPAMFFFASGLEVVNGVFYYPQSTIWTALDPKGQHFAVYNRYQHLTFSSNANVSKEPGFIIQTPFLDQVNIAINPKYFDFNLTSASLVYARTTDEDLMTNPSLHHLTSMNGWSWYEVVQTKHK